MPNRAVTVLIVVTLLPAAARADAPKVQFSKDVLPTFAHRCFECHGNGKRKGDLDMTSRESVLKGGKDGPAIVVGNAAESALIQRVTSHDDTERMPNKGDPLSGAEIAAIRGWINEGAVWDATVASVPSKPVVKPRAVALPAGEGNPIDRLLAPYFAAHHVTPGRPVDDRRFARRAFFDVIGLPPTPGELEAFQGDTSLNKRDLLVRSLLARKQDYAENWMSFWCDMLRSGSTFGIDGKNININGWLLASLRDDLPYDRFVRTLINPPKGGPAGFIEGLKMRGVVETSARTELQASQNIGQIFLGTQLKCAACHDSFVSKWTQAEVWGMAAVFADGPLEIARCEIPTGKVAQPGFIFPELGTIDPKLPRAQQAARLAELVTGKENGLFARTIVNRLWARVMGHGLVEPVDNMENPAWSPDLLDWLASDLVAHDYDVKHTLEVILTSRAYQLPAADDAELRAPGSKETYTFAGPRFRRLTAEQYADALCAIGEVTWGEVTAPPQKATAAKADPKNEMKLGRAWTHNRSTLQEAMGRPDRNNVITVRDSDASTLQALQVLTGPELGGVIEKMAGKLAKGDVSTLTKTVWSRALGREPTAAEMKLAGEVLGEKPTADTVGDLLWLVIATPEFGVLD